ncbi:MAG: PQQ-binding-like beta-propeller repeat protein [Planctomycetaceae bacterium]
MNCSSAFRTCHGYPWIAGVLAGIFLASSPVCGTAWSDEDNATEPQELSTQGLATDRQTILTLEAFRQSIAQSAHDQAAEHLQRLQTSDPSFLVPSASDSETFVPLYRAVFDGFHQLPSVVRNRITAGNSAAADRVLQQATGTHNSQALVDLILRYAGTEASLKAHLLLARMHMDRGHVLASRAWLDPLTSVDVPDAFRRIAVKLVDDLSLPVAAPAQLPDSETNAEAAAPEAAAPDAAAPDAANADASIRSGEAKNIPQQLKWQFRTAMSEKLRQQILRFQDAAQQAHRAPQATWSDLFEDHTAYRRTLSGLAAIDLTTGEPRWQLPLQPHLDSVLTGSVRNASRYSSSVSDANLLFAQLEQTQLAHAFCRDNITGRITADHKRLYLVSSDGNSIQTDRYVNQARFGAFGQFQRTAPFEGSRLMSLEKSTGRRVWSAGSYTVGQHLKNEAGTVWFAGTPTISGQHLFAVLEWNEEIRLGCFAARTGELFWSTVLCFPEQSIDKDPIRRLWSATPTVQQGLIWSPTTAGWITCVDRITQSVVWVSRVEGSAPSAESRSIRRGLSVVVTQPTSLSERWSVSGNTLTSHRLVVTPHEAREIFLLDPLTGRQLHRIPAGRSPLLLHLNDQVMITCEDDSLISRSSVDGQQHWQRKLTETDGLPTGSGVRRGNRLLLPMSNGTIVGVSLSTGAITEQSDKPLPASGWGYLTSGTAIDSTMEPQAVDDFVATTDNDLYYVAPDRLMRISHSMPDDKSRDAIQRASELMAAEKWQDALELSSRIDDHHPGFADAKAIAFECRLHLAMQNPDAHLAELSRAAATLQQRLQVGVLETNVLLEHRAFPEAAKRLIDLLKLSRAELAMPVPMTSVASATQNARLFRPRQSLQTWAATELTDTLNELPNPAVVADRIVDLAPDILLTIHHPAVLPAVHQQIQDSESAETSLQLLRHAIDIRLLAARDNPDSTDLSHEAELFEKLVANVSARPETPVRNAGLLILNVTALEMPAAFLEALKKTRLFGSTQDGAGGFRTREEHRLAFRKSLKEQFEAWTATEYTAVPVVRSSYGTALNSVVPLELEDLFLSRFQWTAVRGDNSRLQAVTVGQSDAEQWTVPGSAPIHRSWSSQPYGLSRHGSILLLSTAQGLSAVSVLDQKVLWSQTYSGSSNLITYSNVSAINFDRFVPELHRLPSQRISNAPGPFAAGHRWLGMKDGSQMQMLDAWSGRNLWSATCPHSECNLFATDDVVLLTSRSSSSMMFDRRSGIDLATDHLHDRISAPVCSAGDLLVCWQQPDHQHGRRLQWLNPRTGTVADEVSLDTMEQFHFIDDRTLVGFNSRREMQVVDLKWRTSQTCSFAVDGNDAVESPAEQADPDDGLHEDPLWSPSRLQASADGLNFYVCNRVIRHRSPIQPLPERQMATFEGELRAVDRETGSLSWSLHNDQVWLATTDQPELPLLVLVRDAEPRGPGQSANHSRFRGITRNGGKDVFDVTIPSGYRSLSLASPAPDTLDLGVQGLRVRLHGRRSPE